MKENTEVELTSSSDLHQSPSFVESSQGSRTQDDLDLSRAGKRPVLKRNFGFMAILGFNCLCLNTWGGTLISFSIGFQNGGPAGLFYGFFIAWMGILATFTTLAELSSIAPISGGQYHWVYMLAPSRVGKSLSFMTGWLTVAGWQGGIASSAFIGGRMIQGFVQVVDSRYEPQLWHSTLFFYAVLLVTVFMNSVVGPKLPQVESVLLVVYIFGFFGVLVPLVYLAPHENASEVFTIFINNGGWSSQTLSFFVGLSAYAFVFLGSDSGYHMSEEVKNAAIVVPRTIIMGIVIDGIVALGMLLAVLFSLGNIDVILATNYVFPFIEILIQATNSVAAVAVILVLMIILQIGLCLAIMAAASRQLWAFSRDKGVPGWQWISKVDRRTTIPVISIIVTMACSLLIGLISIGSDVAFNAVVSLALCNLYASYLIACSLLLWSRCTGGVKERPANQDQSELGDGHALYWGPWRVPGILGLLVNAFACVYLSIVFFFGLWPPATPVEPSTMNWASVVMAATMICSAVYYLVSARHTYTGIIKETRRTDLQRREENVTRVTNETSSR